MAKKVTDTKVLSAVAKHFDKFHESEDFGVVLNNFTSICEHLEISPTHYVNFFPDLSLSIKQYYDKRIVPYLRILVTQKKSKSTHLIRDYFWQLGVF